MPNLLEWISLLQLIKILSMENIFICKLKKYGSKCGNRNLSLLTFISVLIAAVNCKQVSSSCGELNARTAKRSSQDSIHEPTSNLVQEKQSELQLIHQTMDTIETFDLLPANYDPRLTAIFRDSVPVDVLVSFYAMAAGKNPGNNYRWQLYQDGRLFAIHHSGKNVLYDVTFDRPLPKKPTKILPQNKILELYAQFDHVDFFHQPKLQRRPNVYDGGYVIVRVRRGEEFNEVVYQNVGGKLEEYLCSITE